MKKRRSACITRALLLAIPTALAASGAQAAFCPALAQLVKERLKEKGIRLFVVEGETLSPGQIARVRATLDRINALLPPELVAPTEIKISMNRSGGRAVYSELDKTIQAPFDFTDIATKSRRLHYSEATLAHEYGHAVFHANLRTMNPQLYAESEKAAAQLHATLLRLEKIDDEVALLEVQLTLAPNNAQNLKRKNELWAQATQLNAEVDQIANRIGGFNALSKPYSELFADVIAMQATGNPRAISQALIRAAKSAGPPKKGDLLSAEKRNFRVSELTNPRCNENCHTALTPARTHLWQNYLSKKPYAGNPDTLGRIFNAIASEVWRREKAGTVLIPDLTRPREIHEMNETLIRAIDREFAR